MQINKNIKRISMALLGLAAAALLLVYFLPEFTGGSSSAPSLIEQSGVNCLDIADRATAAVVPIIEFQRLELLSRKATVFASCMQDHGFRENPAWAPYAEPIAKRQAVEQHISEGEAIENLRRAQMRVLTPVKGQPMFWVKAN